MGKIRYAVPSSLPTSPAEGFDRFLQSTNDVANVSKLVASKRGKSLKLAAIGCGVLSGTSPNHNLAVRPFGSDRIAKGGRP